MSQFGDFNSIFSASSAGGGGHEYPIFPDRSLSDISDLSSGGGSQSQPDPNGLPIFEIGNGELIGLNQNGQVVSNSQNPSPFVRHVNDITRQFYQKILETVDEDISEDDAATEISTGLTKTINMEEGSPLKQAIDIVIDQYGSNITMIAQNTFDSPDLSVFSQGSTRTQNSASTISAISVLSRLTQPELITPIVNLAIETKNAISKKKIASELVDLTVTGFDYKQPSIEKTLEHNNRFAILKFCCANGIPISGQIGDIQMNRQTEKIFYLIKELEWMLEQGASTKGGTRQLRIESLIFCLRHPSAIHLFDTIYKMLYISHPDAFIKVCAVGGNVLRAFFLALRFARNIANGVPNLPPDDRCTALDDLSPEQIVELGGFAKAIPNLDFLCAKSSDTDLTVIEQLLEEKKLEYVETVENTLHLLCLPPESRSAKYFEMYGKDNSFVLICKGKVKFPLIRMKAVTYENGAYYEEKCGGSIADNTETMKWANYYFRKIKWFAQMIPDDPIEYLDRLSEELGYFNEEGTYKDETFAKFYPEIRKLYCTIQEVKKHNAAMTSVNSDEISQGSFHHLITFTTGCCQIFFDAIRPTVTDDFKNIYKIVQKITPLASHAMFSLLKNPIIEPYITRVLERLNDKNYLSSPKFLETYKTNVHVLTDETGNPVPVKSTCIAVSSAVFGVSNIHKECSAQIRHLFSEFYKLDPSDPFNQNICMTVNCLEFDDPNWSIDDLKEAGEQPANMAIIDFKESDFKESSNKYKKPSETKSNKLTAFTLKMKEPKEKTPKETITVGELREIIRKYNEDKPQKERITGFTSMPKIKLIREIESREIPFKGGAKTRKRKPRKTRKRGKPKHRTTRR